MTTFEQKGNLMKKFWLILTIAILCVSPAMALESTISCDSMVMTTTVNEGTYISASNTVEIAAAGTGYLYLPASMQRSGAFANQLKITSTAAVDIDVSLETCLQDYPTTGDFYLQWSPADNDATVVNITTAGAVTAEVQDAKRLRATIPGKLMRVKIFNDGAATVTVVGAILACW